MQTSEYINKYNNLRKDILEKQKGVSKVPLDPIQNYYKYINELDDLNEEYYAFYTENHKIPSEAIKDIIIPHEETMTVLDMINNNSAITDYCSNSHKQLSTIKNLENMINNLQTVKESTDTAIDYQQKKEHFYTIDWDIESTKYTISLATPENGTVSISPDFADKKATAGSLIPITIIPATNYVIKDIDIKDKENNLIESKISFNNDYTFIMPNSEVTISVSFEEESVSNKYSVKTESTEKVKALLSARSAPSGSEVTMKVSLDLYEAYEISTVLANTIELSNPEIDAENHIYTYKFNMPAESINIKISTIKKDIKINTKQLENGTIALDKNTAQYEDKVQFEVIPSLNYEIESVRVFKILEDKTEIDINLTTENSKYTFIMPAAEVTIEATLRFNGVLHNITITKPDNGNITSNKDKAYNGDKIVLTVTPDKNYKLDTLLLDDVEIIKDSNNEYSFVMGNKDVIVSATFSQMAPLEYNIQIEPTANGTVSISDNDNTKYENEKVILNVLPSEGFKVDSIKIYDENDSLIIEEATKESENEYSFIMPSKSVKVVATFTKEKYRIDILDDDPLKGTIEIEQKDLTNLTFGEKITLTVTAKENYAINTITIDNKQYDIKNNKKEIITFDMPAKNIEITVLYVPSYNVLLETIYNGKASSNITSAVRDEEVIITVTPDEGYETDTVTIKYDSQNIVLTEAEKNKYAFKMPAFDVTVAVSLRAIEYQISTSIDKIKITDDKKIATIGEKVFFTIDSEIGYESSNVRVYSLNITRISLTVEKVGYSFIMPAEDVTITTDFIKSRYRITINPTENGTLTIDSGIDYAYYNDIINITATPSVGYELMGISSDGVSLTPSGNGTGYSFTMPARDIVLIASFEQTFPVELSIAEFSIDPNTKILSFDKVVGAASYEVLVKDYPVAKSRGISNADIVEKKDKVLTTNENGKKIEVDLSVITEVGNWTITIQAKGDGELYLDSPIYTQEIEIV